jgi:hypothetical protein
MYSRLLSSLKVMDKLTRAAIGNGSITGEPPARNKDLKLVSNAMQM